MQVFAYYYPAYHYEPLAFRDLLPGFTEWHLVKNATPYDEHHYQPRKPLWGYEDETDENVMYRKLATAYEYGVDSLLFISYWYDSHPFFAKPLGIALSLAERNPSKVAAPSVMWGNHTRYYCYPENPAVAPKPHLVETYTWKECASMMDFLVSDIFSHPGYHRLPNGKLFFSIYAPQRIVDRLGSADFLSSLLQYVRTVGGKKGLPPLHIHACEARFVTDHKTLLCGFDSCSDYVALGYSENDCGKEPNLALDSLRGELFVNLSDSQRLKRIRETFLRQKLVCPISYYPVVTVGRDCSPRTTITSLPRKGHYGARPVARSFSPRCFESLCIAAVDFLTNFYRGSERFMFINAWNEWTEGAYLEPDCRFGFEFLEVLRSVLRRSK